MRIEKAPAAPGLFCWVGVSCRGANCRHSNTPHHSRASPVRGMASDRRTTRLMAAQSERPPNDAPTSTRSPARQGGLAMRGGFALIPRGRRPLQASPHSRAVPVRGMATDRRTMRFMAAQSAEYPSDAPTSTRSPAQGADWRCTAASPRFRAVGARCQAHHHSRASPVRGVATHRRTSRFMAAQSAEHPSEAPTATKSPARRGGLAMRGGYALIPRERRFGIPRPAASPLGRAQPQAASCALARPIASAACAASRPFSMKCVW